MAGGRRGPLLTALLVAWVAAAAAAEAEAGPEQAALPQERSLVRPMTASNWTLVLEGEWMLKFAYWARPRAGTRPASYLQSRAGPPTLRMRARPSAVRAAGVAHPPLPG
ncbi:hypothetical protein J1605_007331 [Eschrichtius robustus]|uniref:Uncharacterized protein n=1 Tax=Eschrichtius robustus TaxID=9764 RepID=A0AB34H143_ESCRO|nr:hypothetical protein J1605_007331 [Eschrichtius robustus]